MQDICEKYDSSSLQQLLKIVTGEDNNLTKKKVFPVTLIQSIFDAITGNRLDQILALNNHIWLPSRGSKKETRLQVGINARRAGLIVSFKDYDNIIYSQRYINKDSVADEYWGSDDNWEDVFVGLGDTDFIEQVKQYIINYIKDNISEIIPSTGFKFQIVEELPSVGQDNIIYLILDSTSQEDTNTYIEYVWLSDEQKYEVLGSLGNIVVDSSLNSSSENPVQNKVITEALNRINAELFPLSISVSGGGIFEKRTTQTITVRWVVKEGSNTVTPDTVTVNDEVQSSSVSSKVFENVTTNTTYTVKATKDGTTVQGSTSAVFVNPSYFGPVDAGFTPTEDTIKALTKSVKNGKGYTGNTSLTHQKVCYAYPKSMGTLTAIRDANNFEYLQSYTRSEVTVWDETYYVYVLTDPVTITNFRQIYS